MRCSPAPSASGSPSWSLRRQPWRSCATASTRSMWSSTKTLVYFSLAAVITTIYVGIVVGIGAIIGSKGNVGLSILATAIVAVAFQPIRDRSRRFANRLVYGKRATPYEVLSEFADRMAATYSVEDV